MKRTLIVALLFCAFLNADFPHGSVAANIEPASLSEKADAPEKLVFQIRNRVMRSSIDSLATYANKAVVLQGRDRSRKLSNIAGQYAILQMAAEQKYWQGRANEYALQSNDPRTVDEAKLWAIENNESLDYVAKINSFNSVAAHSSDPVVQAEAKLMGSQYMSARGDYVGALQAIEEARSISPSNDPEAKDLQIQALTSEALLYSLINNADGAIIDLRLAEKLKQSDSLPNFDATQLLILSTVAVRQGNEKLSKNIREAQQEIYKHNHTPIDRSRSIGYCVIDAYYFRSPTDVLECLRGVELSDLEDSWRLQIRVWRAISYAKLGRPTEAVAEYKLISELAHKISDLATINQIPHLAAYIKALETNSTEAIELNDKAWVNDRIKTNISMQHTIDQMINRVLSKLDVETENVKLKDRVIRLQWVFGFVTVIASLSVLMALVLQRNVNRRLKAAKAEAEWARQEAINANAIKDQFLANMSHEIRTPLNGIIGMAQAMAVDELSAPQRERLEILKSSSHGMLHILNDVLDIAKIEAGKLSLEWINFDLVPVITGSRAAFHAAAESKNVRIVIEEKEGVAGVYRGDPTRLRQIVDNLLSNAIKFSEGGEVTVEIERDLKMGGVALAVRDTGIGMTDAQVASLFSKFFQADASTTRKFGGTGLGLAICHELVQAFGGQITVSSELGAGTCFRLWLPLERQGDSAAADCIASETDEVDLASSSLKILAAEDHPVNQLVLKTLLSQLGCEVTLVSDGAEALKKFEATRWDLVLMDIQMPNMDGISATAAARAFELRMDMPRTPFIALTANAMKDQIAQYMSAGFDDHLAKPLELAELCDVLNRNI